MKIKAYPKLWVLVKTVPAGKLALTVGRRGQRK